jgi:subtilisin
MNSKKLTVVFIALLVLSCMNSFVVSAFASPPELRRVIVGFEENPSEDLILQHGGRIKYSYKSIRAIACWLPPQAIAALAKNPNVAYIEEDVVVSLLGKPAKKGYLVTRAFLDGVEISVHYEVDGVSRGITPDTLILTPDVYTVTITYEGETQEKLAQVLSRKTTIVEFYFVSPPPPPPQGTLQITTTPVRGDVFINAVSQGPAPIIKTVDVGSYTISFGDVSGYTTPAPQLATIDEGQTTFIEGVYKFIPPPQTGSLTVNAQFNNGTSTSANVDVYLADVLQHQGVTPFTIELEPATYNLTATYDDQTQQRTTEILSGQTTLETFTFEAPLPPPPPTPTDPEIPWGVDRIDAEVVWNTSTGINVQVAILDTGIDRDHPDLKGNILAGINFVWSSIPWLWNPSAWDDDHGHGTWCAGIVGALKNDMGVVGVAPNVDLVAVKVLSASGSGYMSDIIAGIEWCMDNYIDVISMSFAGPDYSNAFHNICNAAYAQGIVLVAAAGNVGDGNPLTDEVQYPAAYESVIAVAGVDQNDVVASFSSDGAEVELAAPAVSINSAWNGGGYNVGSGTSAACPHVSGTVALFMRLDITQPLFAAYDANGNRRWDSWEVRKRLRDTADDLGAAGVDVFYGHGLVDAQEAVTGVQTTP